MKSRNRVAAVLAAAALVFSVLICWEPTGGNKIQRTEGKGAETKDEEELLETEEDGGTIEIEYYIWENEQSYIEPIVDAYEALHPGILVNLHVVNQDIYDNSLEEFLTKNAADLVGVRETSQMVSLAQKGYLLDLTPYMSEYGLEIEAYGNMFNEIGIDGRYFAIPTRSTCWILLYNKDIFDEAQIEYPKQLTWEEYRRLAIELTQEKDGSIQYGGYWPPWCFNFLALQSSSWLIDDDLQAAARSLEMLNTFYNVDRSHVSYLDTAQQQENLSDLFAQGKIAMMPQGEWIINMLMEKQKENGSSVSWGIAPIPVNSEKEAGITWGQYQFVGVSSKTRYPKEVFAFLTFLCGEEGAGILAANGMIPAYWNDKIRAVYAETVGEEIAEVFHDAKRNQEQLAVSHYLELQNVFDICADCYLRGELTLDQAIETFEKLRQEIYGMG